MAIKQFLTTTSKLARPARQAGYWLRRTPPKLWWPTADQLLRAAYFRSPLYPLLEEELTPPSKLTLTPPALWPGDKERGEAISKNQFTYQGRMIQFGNDINWHPREAGERWLSGLHSHDWLADLHALGKAGVGNARRLLEDWLLSCSSYHPQVWRQDVTAVRLINWFTYAPWLLKDIGQSEHDALMYSMADQANYLANAICWHRGGAPLLSNLIALVYAGLILPGGRSTYIEACGHLCQQLGEQVMADGTHISRNPSVQALVLSQLLAMRGVMRKAKQTVPPQVTEAIDKLASALNFMRCGTALPRFNPTTPFSLPDLNKILAQASVSETPESLPQGGFYRLSGGRTELVLFTNPSTPLGDLIGSHANALSFELSHDGHPVFINSGSYGGNQAARQAQRSTSAHNTVVVDRMDSSELWGIHGLGRRPLAVTTTLINEPGTGSGLIAGHNGYRQRGVVHQRRLFLSSNGQDLRGEDTLTAKNKKTHHVAAHFHLHPTVKCHLKNQREAELTLPNRTQLVLKAAGGRFYETLTPVAADDGSKTETHCLVLTSRWGGNPTVLNWALKIATTVAEK